MNESSRILENIKKKIHQAEKKAHRREGTTKLVAVSKTHPIEKIIPFIESGQKIFGENKVQEAQEKWGALDSKWKDVELHLIGPLQSRKVKDAIKLFNVIETLHREKIAAKIAEEMNIQNKIVRLYVQVNIGKEPQKSGVLPEETSHFIDLCKKKYNLAIEGLMCIPPQEGNPHNYFTQLQKLAKDANLSTLSMGMSNDYEIAIGCGATSIRLGSALFGTRNQK